MYAAYLTGFVMAIGHVDLTIAPGGFDFERSRTVPKGRCWCAVSLPEGMLELPHVDKLGDRRLTSFRSPRRALSQPSFPCGPRLPPSL